MAEYNWTAHKRFVLTKEENNTTNKRNQYTRELKLEAIILGVEHKRKIPDVADTLGIGKFILQKWLSHYRQAMNG